MVNTKKTVADPGIFVTSSGQPVYTNYAQFNAYIYKPITLRVIINPFTVNSAIWRFD